MLDIGTVPNPLLSPSLPVFPTTIASAQAIPEQAFARLMAADLTEQFRNTIASVYSEAIVRRSSVMWVSYGSNPRAFDYTHEMFPIYQRRHDWWVGPIHMTLMGRPILWATPVWCHLR